jgi:hypothetical protein
MEPVTTGALVLLGLEVIRDAMRLFPNYDQKIVSKYEHLLREYNEQKTLPYDDENYNDDYFKRVRSELYDIGQKFQEFISTASKKS